MKRKMKIIVIVLLFLGIAGCIFSVVNSFWGNPISILLINHKAENYITETYPDMELQLESAAFNFKNDSYCVYVASPEYVDTYFSLYYSASGKFLSDTYESSVLSGENTLRRLNEEYDNQIRVLSKAEDFTYHTTIYYGEIVGNYEEETTSENSEADNGLDYGIRMEQLVPNQNYDLKEIGTTSGHIVLFLEDENVTSENAASILSDLKRRYDEAGITFYAIDFVLSSPSDTEKPSTSSDEIRLENFLSEDISKANLAEIIQTTNDSLKEESHKEDELKP